MDLARDDEIKSQNAQQNDILGFDSDQVNLLYVHEIVRHGARSPY